MGCGVFDAAKALGEVAAVFHGLELRLRIGIVIRPVGAAVVLGHVYQQSSHRLGAHRGAAVRMQSERTRCHGISNELLGQLRTLTRRNQPAYDVV